MTDDVEPDVTPEPEAQPRRRRQWWWRRMSVRQIKRQAEDIRDLRRRRDEQDNVASRLPGGEEVELAGLVLAEVFAPSTVGRLFEALKEQQDANPYSSGDRGALVKRSRASGGGGWANLGMVRRPGKFLIGNFGISDPKLPVGVDAAFLNVSTVTPSVAVVTVTFALEPGSVDIGAHLAVDRHLTMTDVKVVIPGRLGKLRSRIPWSRPKSHGTTSSMDDVWRLKELAVEDAVRTIEDECAKWFYNQFPGGFSKVSTARRPHVRIVLTEQALPFESGWPRTPIDAAGIGVSWGAYRGSDADTAGWRLSTGSPFRSEREETWVFAARRSDVAYENTRDEPDGTNWTVVQRFADEHSQLVALRALQVMLQSYSTDLADMRDRADRTRRFPRTVREAKTMNTYLLTTGLDVASVTSDVSLLTKNLKRFRWSVAEYHREPDEPTESEPGPNHRDSLVPVMRSSMRWQAKRLARASIDTDQNLRASAELQQAIANTRMQRVVLVLTVVAIAVAVLALFVGGGGS